MKHNLNVRRIMLLEKGLGLAFRQGHSDACVAWCRLKVVPFFFMTAVSSLFTEIIYRPCSNPFAGHAMTDSPNGVMADKSFSIDVEYQQP